MCELEDRPLDISIARSIHRRSSAALLAGVLALLLVLLIPGPSVEAAETVAAPTLPETVRFNRDIRPIFSNTCFACHGPDANKRKMKLRLDVREQAIATRDDFRPVFPGDASKSEAYRLIMAEDPEDRMPPADFHIKLSARDKAMIKKWIDQGAVYEDHWAFLSPKKSAVPKKGLASATSHPIDAFVVRKLEASGLKPSAAADRATLIRRVTLDLTGLPPTPKQVEAFVSDKSADAYEKVVDRLLTSKPYAEHMARHWLDVARYADTNGYQYDRIRHQWVWRDWVINAFATNLPFDQFTIQQVAGDLMPNATAQTKLATGFHRNHPITIEGGVIDEEYRTEYVMDRVVTTTTTWMGLTFLCSRCHDHKYDPISQKDFYSFYAFFNNVPERGLNGFTPKARIASPLQSNQQIEMATKVALLEKAIDAKVNVNQLRVWEKQVTTKVTDQWQLVKPKSMKGVSGSTLASQSDGSVKAIGKNPATETYELSFVADRPILAIQLEALTDPALVSKSVGRGFNGNFVLSEFDVALMAGGKAQPVKIVSAAADYQQKGYPIAAAIDGSSGRGGWAVDGNTRFKPSTATFTLAKPVPADATVRIRLIHTWGGSHTIGRFRLSTAKDGAATIPANVRALLAMPSTKRNASQKATLARYLVGKFGDKEARSLADQLATAQQQLGAAKQTVPDTLILTEMSKPRATFVLDRGEYNKPIKTRPVKPNVPEMLGGLPAGYPQNRLGLAKWLVSRDNPLTARVIVNRYWARLFGTGLVKTIEDFGSQGEYPSHPDLMDWLAVEFVDSNWNVQHLLKTIVTSATYRQSSVVNATAREQDPENRLLAHGPRFRLDAEAIRDGALAVSGLLDPTLGGPSVYPYHPAGLWMEVNNRPGYSRAYPHTTASTNLYRRSMYTFWKRTVPPPSLATFDAPEREFCVVKRSRTNTPLQAFILLHDPQFVEASRHLAERMIKAGASVDAQLNHGFKRCVARPPSDAELKLLRDTYVERLQQYRADAEAARKVLSVGASKRDESIRLAEHAAMTTVARLLMNLSEFITKG